MKQSLINDLLKMAKIQALTGKPKNKDDYMVAGLVKFLENVSDVVGSAILNFKADFALAVQAMSCGDRASNLRSTVHFVINKTEFGNSSEKRALRLNRWNRTFGPDIFLAKRADRVVTNLNIAKEMIDEIYDSGQTVSPAFRHYCKNVDNAPQNIYSMRDTMGKAGKGKMTVYNVIHFLHQNGLKYTNLTADNIVNVFDMAFKAPPNTNFKGVSQWGTGNHKSPKENMQMHFYKHCLDAHPVEKEKNQWLGECEFWWDLLNIDLDHSTAKKLLSSALFGQIDELFTDKNRPLPYSKVPSAVEFARKAGGWGAPMLKHLLDTYGDSYANSAIKMTLNMTDMIVHGDVKKKYAVFLKGIYGKFYVGSRIEGGELTISTCFVPRPDVDLAAVNQDKKLWDVG